MKMPSEAFENSLIQIFCGYTLAVGPSDNVFRRSNMAAGGYRGVATCNQHLSKLFNLRAGWTVANGSDPSGLLKVL